MNGHRANTDPVDNVRRDAKDGAYHCPQCDTPFTRRSNLRRHFQIHTRNALLKCENCQEEYATKQELQQHAGSCYAIAWNHADDRTFRALETALINDTHSDNPGALGVNSRTMNSLMFGNGYVSPAALFPNFDGNYHTSDMGLMSPLSSPAAGAPTHNSSPSYDGNMASLTSLNTFSHRRPSTSSSMSSSSTSSSPYTSTQTLSYPQDTSFSSYPCTEKQASFARWNGVPSSPVNPIDEQPVYTRRQVKDMIDVVSECLIDTMENVMTRTPMPYDSLDGQLVHSMRDAGFRQTVITEAIPRVFYKIHTRGSDTKV